MVCLCSRASKVGAVLTLSCVCRCVSIFFVEFQAHFGADYAATAWIHSLLDCSTMLCGEYRQSDITEWFLWSREAERVCMCSSRRQPGGEPLLRPGGGGGGGPSGLLRPPPQLLRHQPGDALLQRRDPDRSDSDMSSPSYSGVLFIMLTRKICPQVWASPCATPPPSPWWAVTSSGGRRWRTVSPCRAAGSGPSCWLRWCRCSSSCTRGGGHCSSSAPSLQTCASVERCSDQ